MIYQNRNVILYANVILDSIDLCSNLFQFVFQKKTKKLNHTIDI